MKLLSFFPLAAFLGSSVAGAATITCADVSNQVRFTVDLPAGADPADLRDQEISGVRIVNSFTNEEEARLHGLADGGLQWDGLEGGIALRTREGNRLLSVRTGPFDAAGRAEGRFEHGFGALAPRAICRFAE